MRLQSASIGCENRLMHFILRIVWGLILVLLLSSLTACTKEDTSPSLETPRKSEKQLPSQRMLNDVLRDLKKVRLIDCRLDKAGNLTGMSGEKLNGVGNESVIFESSEPYVLKELPELLRIREGVEFNYDSTGTSPTLELATGDGRLVYLGVINGGALRWEKWRCDAFVDNAPGFILWLARHGYSKPARAIQEKIDYEIYEYEKEKKSYDEFVQNMPKSLATFFGPIKCLEASACLEDMSEKYGKISEDARLKLARVALRGEFPDESDQIGALLEWDGKFTRDWASYQSFPLDLLLEYDPEQILSKVKGTELSSAQWVGVCRYYSNLYFRRKFPSGYKPLNMALQRRILKEVRATGEHSLDVEDFEEALQNWSP